MTSWRKRFRIVVAAFRQEWHEKTCAECKAKWMAVGPPRPELVTFCDNCEMETLNGYMEFSERQDQMRGARQ